MANCGKELNAVAVRAMFRHDNCCYTLLLAWFAYRRVRS